MRVMSGKYGFGMALLLRRVYPGYKIIPLLIQLPRGRSPQLTERGSMIAIHCKMTSVRGSWESVSLVDYHFV
jgi:hypothetical protein